MNTTVELLTRILCDTRPDDPEGGAYLYCTTIDNQVSVFRSAKMLISHRMVSRIYILDAQAMSGYPGVVKFQDGLREFGLSANQIECVPYSGTTSINTLTESQALIRFAKEKELGSIAVVSPPFHQFRAFMTAVSAALELFPQLSLYSYPGLTLNWLDLAVHSQGSLQAQRRQLIQDELIRIDTYQKKGDLAGFKDVLDYLDRRDA